MLAEKKGTATEIICREKVLVISHMSDVHSTGVAVETTFTVDMKQHS